MTWTDPESKSRTLYERARQVFPGASTRHPAWVQPYPPYIAYGSGSWVTDVDGQPYLDLSNNHGVLIHGHAPPTVNAAVAEQLERGSCFGLPAESEIRLAEQLCGRVPGFERIRFVTTGTEAIGLALKAARACTGRSRIAKLEGVYHGSNDFAEVGTYSRPEHWRRKPASIPTAAGTPSTVLDQVLVLPTNDTKTTRALLEAHAGDLAAVLVDPVPRRCGFHALDAAYLEMMRAVTRAHGALLIYDEVASFRFGFSGAQGRFGGDPDLTVLGKFIGGGFPTGALAGREQIMSVFGTEALPASVPASGTFNANPVSMVAGQSALSQLDQVAFEDLDAIGEAARTGIEAAIARAAVPAQVTGTGSAFTIHPHTRPIIDYRGYYRTPEDETRAALLQRGLLEHGIILDPSGTGYLSTVVRSAELDLLFEALDDLLPRIFAQDLAS